MKASDLVLFSGATKGAEAEFGRLAEEHGIQEVNFTFEGHPNARRRGIHELPPADLLKGDVSLTYVSRLMSRNYIHKGEIFRKVLQTLFHIINNSQEVFVIGEIMDDMTVRGGTGWGTEFAKLCNKRLFVFDQKRKGWHRWDGASSNWERMEGAALPTISAHHFAGIGTRHLKPNGKAAIEDLYARSLAELPN
ncbi:MAG: hypothetical protein HY342_09430 [Candidatus Lambdaproteobacteria bacterium]|nr:hypothetical protein [Candidatus Lambdaproteobacteria bacterium]